VVFDALDVDAMFHTSAAGVVAAGDVSVQMPSLATCGRRGLECRGDDRHDAMADAPG